MSGRIRTIKPEWLDDERLALASAEARVLSVALMLLADDYGNGRANEVLLSGRVFPRERSLETLANALAELVSTSFVQLYEVDGQQYFSIRNWRKHQRVDKPGKPRVPGPCTTVENIRETAENVPASRGSRSRSRSFPDPDPEGGVGETKSERATSPPANLAEALDVPPQERARQVERDPHLAEWILPQDWPEVRELAKAWGERRVGAYKRDSGVRAVVGCLADGFTLQELLRAIPRIRGSDWGKSRKLGMACMTPEVVRRALDNSQESNTVNKLEAFEDALWKAKHAAT